MEKEKTTIINYRYFIVFFFIISITFSQQKKFNIEWTSPIELSTEVSSIEVPHFNKDNFYFGYDRGLKFIAQWPESQFVGKNSISITNVSYSPISKSELKGLDIATIPNQLVYSLNNATARDVNYAALELSPIINNNGQFQKITSFTVNYSQGRSSSLNRNSQDISNSVLASGEWKRFYVDKSGVFKISKSFLNSIGLNTNVDPRTIKIYGNGGRMMPLLNSQSFPFDPEENTIQFVGEADGVFNNDDYILFYAEGPYEFNEDSNTNINSFTEKTFYYITSSPGFGKRIQTASQPITTPDVIIDTFQDYQFHEVDQTNLAKIGRRWFGERFDIENERDFSFNFPNYFSDPFCNFVFLGFEDKLLLETIKIIHIYITYTLIFSYSKGNALLFFLGININIRIE